MKEYTASSAQIAIIPSGKMFKEYSNIAITLEEDNDGKKIVFPQGEESFLDKVKRSAAAAGNVACNHAEDIVTGIGAAALLLATGKRIPHTNVGQVISSEIRDENRELERLHALYYTLCLKDVEKVETQAGHKCVTVYTSQAIYRINFDQAQGKTFYQELMSELNW